MKRRLTESVRTCTISEKGLEPRFVRNRQQAEGACDGKECSTFMSRTSWFFSVRKWFKLIFVYRFKYLAAMVAYANPTVRRWLIKAIGYKSIDCSPEFWDSELRGSKSFWLGTGLPLEARRCVILAFIRPLLVRPVSLLDIGCGSGLMLQALDGATVERYVGVDISKHAIEEAAKNLAGHKHWNNVRLEVSDLRDFTPQDSSLFDAIVFNEVLYLIDAEEVVEQLKRYANWLQPHGYFCISMKDNPKSHLIYRLVSRHFEPVQSILLQVRPRKVGYRLVRNGYTARFVIATFRLKGQAPKR